MKSKANYPLLSAITILAFFSFRLFYIATTHYNLIADEAYFWDWSRHLALSYYDMGPMVAWIIRFFTTLLGVSEFSVRLGAPVFAALTAALSYRLAAEITESSRLAFYFVLLFHITPIATAGGIIMTYYSPQVFFMAATALSLWRLIKTGNGRWWYAVGASLGLGFLSHHMFSIFSAEVVLFICLSAANRKWLLRKEPYLALVIELALASPVLIWNFTHQAVMAKHAVGLLSLSPKALQVFLDFIGGQAGVQTPLLFLAVVYAVAVSAYRGIVGKDDRHLFLFCLSGPLLLFIALLCLGGRTEANWPISGYITGTLSALVVFAEKFEAGSRRLRSIIASAAGVTVFLGLSVLVVACYPQILPRVFGVQLPPRMDPANRLYGWTTIGKEASMVLAGMPPGSFVCTRDYGLSSLMAFYMQGRPQVYELPDGRRMSQYDFWNPGLSVKNRDAVFINGSPMGERSRKLFKRVQLAKRVPIYVSGSSILRKEYFIYACYGYKGAPEEFESY